MRASRGPKSGRDLPEAAFAPEYAEYFHGQCRDLPNGCRIWDRSLFESGYGQCHVIGMYGAMPAHRVAWVLHNKRQVSPGMVIRHTCYLKSCVNPDHLVEGTQGENMADIHRKGEKGPRSKLFCRHGNRKHGFNPCEDCRKMREEGYVSRAEGFGIPTAGAWPDTEEQLIALVGKRDAEFLVRYYGLHGHQCETLQHIGTDWKITRERVRQCLVRARKTLGVSVAKPSDTTVVGVN